MHDIDAISREEMLQLKVNPGEATVDQVRRLVEELELLRPRVPNAEALRISHEQHVCTLEDRAEAAEAEVRELKEHVKLLLGLIPPGLVSFFSEYDQLIRKLVTLPLDDRPELKRQLQLTRRAHERWSAAQQQGLRNLLAGHQHGESNEEGKLSTL